MVHNVRDVGHGDPMRELARQHACLRGRTKDERVIESLQPLGGSVSPQHLCHRVAGTRQGADEAAPQPAPVGRDVGVAVRGVEDIVDGVRVRHRPRQMRDVGNDLIHGTPGLEASARVW